MSFSLNLFDFLLVAVLAGGLFYGRKRGLSVELFGAMKWLTLLLGCALIYQPAGILISQATGLSLLASYLLTYVVTALLLFLVFSKVQKRLAPKLVGTDAFGRGEYYLGMASGVVQFACMLLIGLALLNARSFSPAELKAIQQYEEAAYGSSVFPNWHSFQEAVFENSLFGPWIHQELSFLLIVPTEMDQTEPGDKHPKALPTTARK